MSVSARSYMSASLAAVLTAGVVAVAPVTPELATPRSTIADVALASTEVIAPGASVANFFVWNIAQLRTFGWQVLPPPLGEGAGAPPPAFLKPTETVLRVSVDGLTNAFYDGYGGHTGVAGFVDYWLDNTWADVIATWVKGRPPASLVAERQAFFGLKAPKVPLAASLPSRPTASLASRARAASVTPRQSPLVKAAATAAKPVTQRSARKAAR